MVCPLNKSEYEEMGDSFLVVQLSQGTVWHRWSPENEAQPIIERFATRTTRHVPWSSDYFDIQNLIFHLDFQ